LHKVTIGHAYFGQEDDRDDLKYYEHNINKTKRKYDIR